MATFTATTYPLAFAHMEGGVKSVYVVPRSPEFAGVTFGDRLEFEDIGSITIGMVRSYPSIEALVEAEGYANVVPEAEDARQAVDLIRGSSGWDHEAEATGILALRVRSARRKA